MCVQITGRKDRYHHRRERERERSDSSDYEQEQVGARLVLLLEFYGGHGRCDECACWAQMADGLGDDLHACAHCTRPA